jgi:hypothetical protein
MTKQTKEGETMKQDLQGVTTEHWMDRRLRENKPINYPTNLIRISAKDIVTLVEHKNQMLGVRRSLLQESEEHDRRSREEVES